VRPAIAAVLAIAAAAVVAGCGRSTSDQPTALAASSPTAVANNAATNTNPNTTTPPAPPTTPAPPPPTVPRPHIVQRPIPFNAQRKAEMVAYARRHYGLDTYHLIDPHVIVEHYTETPDFQSTWNTFAPDVPDSELHELPNTCAHFVVDSDGTIYELVPVSIMCRHTVGLNWTAIGIENVGDSDQQILDDPRQLHASLTLTRWLRCRFGIPIRDVIGHNESLSSPYHHENVPSLRTQTHNDWTHSDMVRYRADLRRLGGC
jgi:hypothetical protein